MTDYSVPPSRITDSHLHSICGYHVRQLMELELEPEPEPEQELELEQYSTVVTVQSWRILLEQELDPALLLR